MTRLVLFIGAAMLAYGSATAHAQSQAEGPETELLGPRERLSLWPLKRDVLARTSGLPMYLRYEEMSPAQQMTVKGQYEHLGPDDDPPFPASGLAPLIQAVHKLQHELLVEGDLDLVADVGSDGRVVQVAAYSSPSKEMTHAVAQILVLTPFRPAKCSGKPCAQQFPLRLRFAVRER